MDDEKFGPVQIAAEIAGAIGIAINAVLVVWTIGMAVDPDWTIAGWVGWFG